MFDDNVLERYSLAIERIAEINSECEIKNNKHKDYFNKVSAFILLMDKLKSDVADDAACFTTIISSVIFSGTRSCFRYNMHSLLYVSLLVQNIMLIFE